MLKNKAVSLAVVSMLSACATPSYNYMPKTIAISKPPLDSVNTSQVGDVMLQQGKYQEHEAIRVKAAINIAWAYTIHPGYFLKQGDTETDEFYRPGGGGDAGYIEKSALADPWKNVMTKRGSNNICIVTVFNLSGCNESTDFERIMKPVISQDSFQQTLIYNGKVGNKINVGYREFSGNMARPGFNNNVEYDLSETKTIGYKDALIEIIEATNQHIKYKVIRNFNNATF